MYTRVNLKERDYLENFDVDGRMTLKSFPHEWDGWTWTGFISLCISASGSPFVKTIMKFVFMNSMLLYYMDLVG
jgi:hypothetical protein